MPAIPQDEPLSGAAIALIVLITLILLSMIGGGCYANREYILLATERRRSPELCASSAAKTEFELLREGHERTREHRREEPGQVLSRLLPKHLNR